jgi:hypothetical protein
MDCFIDMMALILSSHCYIISNEKGWYSGENKCIFDNFIFSDIHQI